MVSSEDAIAMMLVDETLFLAATDLSNHLGCQHLTMLNREVAFGRLPRPSGGGRRLGGARRARPRARSGLRGAPSSPGPLICDFTSELFYERRLQAHASTEHHLLHGDTPFAGAGLWTVPVEHQGNQSRSDEEVRAVASIYNHRLRLGSRWTNRDAVTHRITTDEILIVAPYNAQVAAMKDALPQALIGTVDKFQGQEAPFVIYSMTTSSKEGAPRGNEFLFIRDGKDRHNELLRSPVIEEEPKSKGRYMSNFERKSFSGQPFSAVFAREKKMGSATWRLKGSGIRGRPTKALTTATIVETLEECGYHIESSSGGNPIMDVISYSCRCRAVGGEFWAETGNYSFAPRGAWVRGAELALAIALHLGLRVTDQWRDEFGTPSSKDEDLLEDFRAGYT